MVFLNRRKFRFHYYSYFSNRFKEVNFLLYILYNRAGKPYFTTSREFQSAHALKVLIYNIFVSPYFLFLDAWTFEKNEQHIVSII